MMETFTVGIVALIGALGSLYGLMRWAYGIGYRDACRQAALVCLARGEQLSGWAFDPKFPEQAQETFCEMANDQLDSARIIKELTPSSTGNRRHRTGEDIVSENFWLSDPPPAGMRAE